MWLVKKIALRSQSIWSETVHALVNFPALDFIHLEFWLVDCDGYFEFALYYAKNATGQKYRATFSIN